VAEARQPPTAAARALLGLALAACLPGDGVGSLEGALVLDAAHGGRPGFYFLPPLVEPTPLPPSFDPGLTLVARLEGPAGVLATFPLTVQGSQERYRGMLDTSALGLDPAQVYRVRVLAGALELGYADVRVFTSNREARSEATDEYFELVEGKKLRIEVYVNRCATVTCAGATACQEAATCDGETGACLAGDPIPCGTLEVSANVDEVAATGADLALDAAVAVAGATILPDAPAELSGFWPATGDTGLAVTLAGQVGAWAPRSSRLACAPLALAQLSATGGAAFADLVEESRGEAELCVGSLDGAHLLEVRLARTGPARTATLAGVSTATLEFESRLAVELPAPAFDGQTLDLRVLDGAGGPLPLRGALAVAPWYRAGLAGTASFDFRPTAD
jgi:hypothetical protein